MAQSFKGVGGAPGLAIGPAAYIQSHTGAPPVDLCPSDALARFAQAQAAAAGRLRTLAEQFRAEGRAEEAGIFDAQALLVEDDFLVAEVTRLVTDEAAQLEDALDETVAQMREALATLDDEYLRERAADMDAIGSEIHKALQGHSGPIAVPPGAIVLAEDLTPTETAELRGAVAGFATAGGGPTGHTAILARSLGIPAVVGLGAAALQIAEGAPLILDGDSSLLLANPSQAERAHYTERAAAQASEAARLAELRTTPGRLADGTAVALWANVGGPEETEAALAHGAEGIGLFRTEFLFLQRSTAPTEHDHYQAYRRTMEAMGGRTVVIRTLDIGGDKPLPYISMPHEANPFLGVRGLRLCMRHPELFAAQLRGLLRAARHGDLWVMLPMVATPADLAWGRAQVQAAAEALAAEGVEHRADVPLGVMIETPAAAVTADLLARDAAFFSVGTNDLTQYAMAADRGQAELASAYPHSSPAVLRLIATAADAAHRASIPIGICGELGSVPEAAAILAGLGIDEISMAPASIPRVKDTLAQLTLAEAQARAKAALNG